MGKPSSYPDYSITNAKTRLEMPLMEMRITNVSVIAHLHDKYGAGTVLHRITVRGSLSSTSATRPIRARITCKYVWVWMIAGVCHASFGSRRCSGMRAKALQVLRRSRDHACLA